MLFNQVQFLPFAYLLVLLWVVSATVLAKLLGNLLVEATTGTLHTLLNRQVNIDVSGDSIIFHLFEERVVSFFNMRIWFDLAHHFARMLGLGILCPAPTQAFVLQKILVPEQYRSGCPPNSYPWFAC